MPDYENGDAALGSQPAAIDTAAVRELFGMMKAISGTLDQTFRTLNDQFPQVSQLGPTEEMARGGIEAVRKEIEAQESAQDDCFEKIRVSIKKALKIEAGKQSREDIQEQIKSEIAKQAKAQISLQIPEFLPVSLEQLSEDSRKQLAEVQNALKNSEARRKNSNLRPYPQNLNDTLEVVLKSDGTKSAIYPANLRSLFAYDVAKTRQLLQDFGLNDQHDRDKNLNRFMAHIGVAAVPIAVVSFVPTWS